MCVCVCVCVYSFYFFFFFFNYFLFDFLFPLFSLFSVRFPLFVDNFSFHFFFSFSFSSFFFSFFALNSLPHTEYTIYPFLSQILSIHLFLLSSVSYFSKIHQFLWFPLQHNFQPREFKKKAFLPIFPYFPHSPASTASFREAKKC